MLSANRTVSLSLIIIISLCLLRFISLGLYPLFDTTEARYGEIARIMFETRNWITPQFDYNIPFWGKPPLHTWVSAISFALFGVSEFSARLPHFIAGILVMVVVYMFAAKHFSKEVAQRSLLVLASCLGFQIAIGMVMTDSLLLLAITLAMTSFYHCYFHHSKLAGFIFFVALAIGMLAKGPVAVVLIGMPLTLWSLHHKVLFSALKSLPWLAGFPLFIALTLPWYLFAEHATPGFLRYFIWGEHVERFLVSGWQGDLYGSAHQESKGTIWLFWLAVAFPWSFVLIWQLVKSPITKRKSAYTVKQNKKCTQHYFIYWLIAPMLLFTFAGNILAAYVLPSLPALALLIAFSTTQLRTLLVFATSSTALIVLAMTYFIAGFSSKVSHKDVLKNLSSHQMSQPLYYWQKRPFSAQFYSNGAAQKLTTISELMILDELNSPFILVVNHKHQEAISVYVQSQCTNFDTTKGFDLYQCGK